MNITLGFSTYLLLRVENAFLRREESVLESCHDDSSLLVSNVPGIMACCLAALSATFLWGKNTIQKDKSVKFMS